jgi:CubicO group peptidase (beta-lactamase class C family)
MRTKSNLLFLVLAFFSSIACLGPAQARVQGAAAQPLSKALPIIEQIYRAQAEKNHLPGLAFGVVLDSQLVCSGGVGFANLEKRIPATSRSLFRIASMTKSITAMAVLRLRDQGKLALDDPVARYIPEMSSLHHLTSDAPKITIRHLLTHTAGFPEDNPWGDRQLAASDQELMQLVQTGISFSHVPGVAYEYSNLGFALLGKIITNLSGRPYQQYVTENILRPLEMNRSIWEYAHLPEDQLACGYHWQGGQWNALTPLHDGVYASMGGLITSVEDFCKYMIYHLAAWPPRDRVRSQPLSAGSLREMQQPQVFINMNASSRRADGRTCPSVSGYGYGLRWVKDCSGTVYIGHGGGLPGFGSQWRFLPDYGLAVVALSNLTYADLGAANEAVLDTLIAIGHLTPRRQPASAILLQRRDELIRLLPDWGVFDPALFGENFFLDYSLDSLRTSFKKMYRQAGKIIGVKEVVPENELRGSFIIDGENADIELFFTLTPQNPPRIQYIKFTTIP